MKITTRHIRPGVQGYALTITLIFLAVVLTIFGSIMYWTSTNARITLRNNQYNMSQSAAESAVERVVGQMDRDFISQTILGTSSYTGLPAASPSLGGIDQSSWPVQYTFSDTNGNANVISVIAGPVNGSTVPLNSQYAGLYGLAQTYDVYATATPVGQPQTVPATVHETVQFANIPLFQFAIFYNVNLEIAPGAPMTISGPVFCNQSIWEGAADTTYTTNVTAVGTNNTTTLDPFSDNYTDTGNPTFQMAGQPVNNANALVMPIGTNNNPATILGLLQIPPAAYAMGTAAAYSSNGIVYPANGADLVISNFVSGTNDGLSIPTGTNMIVYFQDSGKAQTLTPIPYDFYILKHAATTGLYTNYVSPNLSDTNKCYTNILFAGFSWVTNAVFYDWREGWNGGSGTGKRVEAVQIDMNLLNKWLTNQLVNSSASGYSWDNTYKVPHSGHHIDCIYVYNSVALSSVQLPAVRVVNGSLLPTPGGSTNGFTVATPFPMYVWGDYNSQSRNGSSLGLNTTTNTYPAALMADAVTILSDSWSDATTTKNPPSSATTVNAGMLEGIVQTDPTISGDYSGGAENFLRLLEDWSGNTLTYNGSIVVLFYSQCATNHWHGPGGGTGGSYYYGAPSRHWAFDLNFTKSSGLPPLTPSLVNLVTP